MIILDSGLLFWATLYIATVASMKAFSLHHGHRKSYNRLFDRYCKTINRPNRPIANHIIIWCWKAQTTGQNNIWTYTVHVRDCMQRNSKTR